MTDMDRDEFVAQRSRRAMTDIVARLRDWPRMTPAACKEAADEIERLRALLRDRPRDDGTAVAVGGEPGASAGKSE